MQTKMLESNLVCKMVERDGVEALYANPLLAGSTGNHGQSIAYAGRLFNIPVKIVVPEEANESKVQEKLHFKNYLVLEKKDCFFLLLI